MASKGFKYAKGKKLEDPEELSYDDVEEPRKDSGAKRKGSQNDTSISSKKSRTSGASARSNASAGSHSKSSHSKSKTQTAQKHHYPTSSYELSAELLDSGKRHQGVLSDLVDEIATAERRTLQAYARSEQSRTLKGKKHIFESMDAVLKDMATEVHKLCPPEVVFEPEVPRAERSQLKPLQDTKRLLEQHSHKLELFENNIAHLAKEYDLWLGSDAVAERLEHAAQGHVAQGTELETMRQYQELLQALEHHCDQILASEEVTEGAIAQAQQAKDKLYLTFSKAREVATHGNKVPKDPKDLLKKMPAFF